MKIKHTIAGKLILYFAAFLLLFAVLVGTVFSVLLTRQTAALHKQELGEKAESIADTLSGYMSHAKGRGHGRQRQEPGYGAYMQLLDDIAMTDVWIMDSDSQLITFAQGNSTLHFSELPAGAEEVINQALNGQLAFGDSFSQLLGVKSVTAGAPVFSHSGQAIGVVLLHAPIGGIGTAVANGLGIMGLSMILALTLAAAAAILLAFHFTKPLRILKEAAGRMAKGDYEVRTNILQKDEIGEVAASFDQLAGQLAAAARESEKLTRLRQDFISNISHELRTPVTVIRGSLEALCDHVVTDSHMVEDYHRQMLTDSIFLERLVNDLLELTRLQNTDFPIEKQTIDLCDIINDAVRSMRQPALQKQISVSVRLNPPVCIIEGDYGRIRQMLLIVLDNAIKFSPMEETVTITLEQKGEHFLLSFSNHGELIPTEKIPFLFDRFYSSKDEGNKTGTGLGLTIAKQIAIRHDIELTAESSQGETVFRFIF